MSPGGLLSVAGRLAGAALLNLLLLAVLTRLNREEAVSAEPVVVARLRAPEPPLTEPTTKEPIPNEEPEPAETDVPEVQEPEPPMADIDPVAVPAVRLDVDVPVAVRPLTVPVRAVTRASAPRTPRRSAPRRPAPPRRTLGSDEVDEPPREVRIRRPAYPDAALRLGIEGNATVKLLIDEDGGVQKVELVDTRGSRHFGSAVLAVARSWRFTGAKNDGAPVRCWVLKTVRFRLESGS